MVTTNDPHLAERVRRLRDHGRTGKYEHAESGWGYRMDALQAAVLGAKLPHLEEWTARRRTAAERYNRLLAGAEIFTPAERPYNRHVYHCYVIRSPRRDALAQYLGSQGIGVGVHYPIPLHLQPASQALGLSRGSLPVAEAVAGQVLSLPIYPEITPAQQQYVADAVKAFVESGPQLVRDA